MSDIEQGPGPDEADWDMSVARARAKLKLDQSKKGRQARQKKITQSVAREARDGRSLRATGRTEQFNFKAFPGLKLAAQKAAKRQGLTLAEWMEKTINAALEAEGEARGDA